MFASKVVWLFTMMIVMELKVQGVPLSFENVLNTPLRVHCTTGAQDVGTRTVSPWKEYSVFLPTGYYGTYVCTFSAAGNRTTTFDALNSPCKCDSYYGCAWVAKKDGFYCNLGIVYKDGPRKSASKLEESIRTTS